MAAAAIAPAPRFLSPARRLQLVALAGVWIAWELLSASGLLYRGVVPSTVLVAEALAGLLAMPRFWYNFAVTAFEILGAIAIGTAAGMLAGVVIGRSAFLAAATEPIVNAFAATPKILFLPIFYLLFGIGSGSKVAVGGLGCFFPIVVSVIAGMRAINPTFIRVGRSFRLTRTQMATKIYLPSLVEAVANGLRIAVGAAIGICLIAETRFSYAGLGFMVIDAYNRSRFPEVYAVLAIIVALAAAADALIGRIARRR